MHDFCIVCRTCGAFQRAENALAQSGNRATHALGPPSFWYDAVMMPPLPINFFDYTCDRCGAPVCERVQLMNLALNYEEELFCLDCLAAEQDMPAEALADFAKSYVYSRDCFKNPWMKFDVTPCPKRTDGLCFCQDSAS